MLVPSSAANRILMFDSRNARENFTSFFVARCEWMCVRRMFEKGLRDERKLHRGGAEIAEARLKFRARLRALCASAVNPFFVTAPGIATRR